MDDWVCVTTCSRILFVFLKLCFLFGICKGDGTTKEFLEAGIKNTKEDAVAVTKDDEELIIKEMIEEAASCEGKINVAAWINTNCPAANQAKHKTRVDLYKELVKSYDEEDQLKEAYLDIGKLKLGIEILNGVIRGLKTVKSNSCFDLEGMVNHIEDPKSSALSNARFREIIFLENQLRNDIVPVIIEHEKPTIL